MVSTLSLSHVVWDRDHFSKANIIAVIDCNDGGTIGAAIQRVSRCLTSGLERRMDWL